MDGTMTVAITQLIAAVFEECTAAVGFDSLCEECYNTRGRMIAENMN